jgi:hypothetical protein
MQLNFFEQKKHSIKKECFLKGDLGLTDYWG